jgi:uncharacterized protein (TIGR03032 family)
MMDGRVRIVSVCSTTDIVEGWRERRGDGGAIIEVETDRIVVEGLSMPHSQRLHDGAIWALNSGSGHLLRIDPETGKSRGGRLRAGLPSRPRLLRRLRRRRTVPAAHRPFEGLGS